MNRKRKAVNPDDRALNLQLIFGFHLSHQESEIRISSSNGKQLLAYLGLCASYGENRARLAAILWEDSDEHRARRNLRQVLHQLRVDFSGVWDGVEADRSTVRLKAESFVSDFDSILSDLRSMDVPDIAINTRLLHEQLLSGMPVSGELYESWLRLRRSEFQNTIRGYLESILENGSKQQAERAARALLSLDDSDENAARFLIRHYHDNGEIGRALGVYAALWEHLDEEYGMEPAQLTQDLMVDVKSGTRSPPQRVENGKPKALTASHPKLDLASASFR